MRVVDVGDPTLCLTCGLPSLFGGAVHDAAGAVLDTFISALNSAAAWMVGHVVDLVTTSQAITGPTQVQMGPGSWFFRQSGLMLQLGALVVAPLLFAATIGAVLRQDLRRLGRVWGVGLPVAILAGWLGTQLTSVALSATDALCAAVLATTGGKVHGDLKALTTAMVIPGAPQLVAAFISFLLIVGAILLWLELVLRAAAIYVAAWFMPLALAAYVWPSTAGIAKRTVELLVALILSKFVIVATLTLGVDALSAGPSADNAVIGSAILLLAAFAPFSLLRLAPIVEMGAIAHLEGMARRPARAATRAASTAAAAPGHPAIQLITSRMSPEHRPPGTSSVGAHRLAERGPDYRGGQGNAGAGAAAAAGAGQERPDG
jgi:hypothetical protein